MRNETGNVSKAPEARESKHPYTRARKAVLALVFVSVIVSLIWHTGTGTPSALGISSIAAVCPLASLETMLAGRNLMLHPLVLFVVSVVIALLVGKAFCSWVCPTPYLQKLFGKNRSKDAGKTTSPSKSPDTLADSAEKAWGTRSLAPIGGRRDGVRFDGRHVVLIGTLASSFIFGFPVFCLVCPVGLVFGTVIGVWHLFQYNEVSWLLVAMPVVLVLELVFLRKWCTTLCPISALVSLISAGNKTFKPCVSDESCLRTKGVDCRICVENCPEEVDPHSESIPECSKCGICIEGCPAHAIEMKLLSFSSSSKE